MSNPAVSVATEQSSAIPVDARRSRRLKLVVASVLALSGPVAFAATAWAGCSAG
jgi:hypothetical protein